jgi:energy-coupling factor transport system ATP-binding protein
MIEIHNLSYHYPEAQRAALQDISLELPEASFTLIVGASGSGKSTLLRCLNGLVPHFSGGQLSGHIRVAGLDPIVVGPQVMSRRVGFVFQDPEAQFVMGRVEDELAFALENAGMARQEMRIRIEEVLDLLDLAPLRSRSLATLSGGERQRVAIAAALALRPQILALDEPTSQLDPQSAEDVLQALVRLNSDLGLSIVLVEHRLERVLPFVDSIVAMAPDGTGSRVGEPRAMLAHLEQIPPLVQVGKVLGWQPLPLTIKEGQRFARRQELPAASGVAQRPAMGEPRIRIRGVGSAYQGRPVLHNIQMEVRTGEIVVLMGRNGSGKSTLLKNIIGLIRTRRGSIELSGRTIAGRGVAEICREVGYLPQDPDALLFAESVREELLTTLRNHGLANTGHEEVAELLLRLGLAEKAERYPRDLSAGERLRVAIGAIAVVRPGTLMLDEPTRGLDYGAKASLAQLLREWRNQHTAILLVTHDVEFAADIADRVILLSQGEIIASGSAADVMGNSPLFAPQIARLFPGRGLLRVADVVGEG